MQDLKHLVESGKLGRLLLGNATVRWYRPQSYYEDGWHGTRAMDGGALMNQSIHHIDALQWIMGDVERAFAYGATLAHKMECEDVGVAVLRFASGALGVIEDRPLPGPRTSKAPLPSSASVARSRSAARRSTARCFGRSRANSNKNVS